MVRINRLPDDNAASLSGTDLVPVLDVESDTTKQVEVEELLSATELATPRWDDLRVSLISTNASGSNPPTLTRVYRNQNGTSQGVFAYGFPTATEKELFFDVQMPHAWVAGSEVRPHVHWIHQEGTVPGDTNVRWGLEYTWSNPVNSPGNVFGDTATVYADDDVTQAANEHLIWQFTPIAGTGKRASAVMLCRLFREVSNDNFAGSAYAVSFDLHYQSNSLGSVDEYPSP